jgi:glycosyltransferase involved in cell wall biosynthesis
MSEILMQERKRPSGPPLYLCGVPGKIGGASTKMHHLIRLLSEDFRITLIASEMGIYKSKEVRQLLEPCGVECVTMKELPKQLRGVALGICDRDFFSSNRARELRSRGLKIVWSNEMMFPFKGEEEAARQGLIDRVLFVSDFQARVFENIYANVSSRRTGNYIDPDDYSYSERRNPTFTIGRLSRPDLTKYPLDFPVFYEEIGIKEVRYRVMAWSSELQKQYRWHNFGPEWDLLAENKTSALNFLYTLSVFLYPLGHRVKESWGRAVVESMLTGCVPVVPSGHQFHNLILHGETGFICKEFHEFKSCVWELYENNQFRLKIARQAATFAREQLCDKEKHRRLWIEALTI